jgi:hypothetical protein
MKAVSTTLSTGDKITAPGTTLKGEIGTIKKGVIRIFWTINGYSGYSEFMPTRELNRRIKDGKIEKVQPELNHN